MKLNIQLKVLSEEQGVTDTQTTGRGTQQTATSPAMDEKWCLSCIRQATI
jgi:hypothetical protein